MPLKNLADWKVDNTLAIQLSVDYRPNSSPQRGDLPVVTTTTPANTTL
jgi:hypothetical protein